MAEDKSDDPTEPNGTKETILSALPRTHPADLQAMENRRLTEAHYAAIGRVAAEWSYFEAVIDTWLHHFANISPEIGVCFTGQMIGPRPRVDAFIALVRHSGAAKKWNEKLEELAKDVSGLAEQRNRIIHDVWMLQEASQPKRLETSARRKVRIEAITAPTQDVYYLLMNINTLQERFDDMASLIFTEINTLSAPPSERIE